MGYPYEGPAFDVLPESIRNRVQVAAMLARNETCALGVALSNQTKRHGKNADPAKMWKMFGDAEEVFIYDFGTLHDVYFRKDDQIFHLSFIGSGSPDVMERVEKALGLNVVVRPAHNQAGALVKFGAEPLERLVGLGHQPNIREDPFKYQHGASGPYMALR